MNILWSVICRNSVRPWANVQVGLVVTSSHCARNKLFDESIIYRVHKGPWRPWKYLNPISHFQGLESAWICLIHIKFLENTWILVILSTITHFYLCINGNKCLKQYQLCSMGTLRCAYKFLKICLECSKSGLMSLSNYIVLPWKVLDFYQQKNTQALCSYLANVQYKLILKITSDWKSINLS